MHMHIKPLSFSWCPYTVSFFNDQDSDELLWPVHVTLRAGFKKKEGKKKKVLRYIKTKNDCALKSSDIMNQTLCLIL